jgi:F0F1-type ATP synthase assembly protein I
MDPESDRRDPDDRAAFAKALDVAYQLMAVCAMFALPAVAGQFVDRWLGTGFLLTVIGAVFGLATAVFQFRKMVRRFEASDSSSKERPHGDKKEQ